MPSKSKSQERLMQAVANNPKFAKKVGIPQSVGRDFAAADRNKKRKNKMNKFIEIITQPSTWRGLVWMLTAIGINLNPEQSQAVITAGMGVAGIIGAFTSDK